MFLRAARALRRTPVFTASAVLTLALGLGTALTLFGAFYVVLLRLPPFPGAGRIYRVFLEEQARNHRRLDVVPPIAFAEAARPGPVVEASGMMSRYGFTTWDGPSGPVKLGIYRVDVALRDVLVWRPLLGRWFTAEEQRAGTGWVIGHRFWKTHLGGDLQWIGRLLTIGGETQPVLGVSRPDFELPVESGHEVEVLAPLAPDAGPDHPRAVGLVRLAGNASPGAAADWLGERLQAIRGTRDFAVRLTPLAEVLRGPVTASFRLVCAAGGLVLVLTFASVAGLFLSRSAARRGDAAIRLALGSTKRRVFVEAFLEASLVVAVASALAIGLSLAASRLLRAWLPGGDQLHGVEQAWSDPMMAIVTVGGGVLLSLVLALVSAAAGARTLPNPARALGEHAPTKGTGRRWIVAAQVAGSVAALSVASLLGASLLALVREDLGFRTKGIVKVSLTEKDFSAPHSPDESSEAAVAAMEEALAELRARPGISDAALGELTLTSEGSPGDDAPWNRLARVSTSAIGSRFVEAMGLRVVAGRAFTSDDILRARRVCLIDTTAARVLFPGGAIGRTVPSMFLMRFQLNFRGYSRDFLPQQPLEVVGVVEPVRPRGLLDQAGPSMLWTPSSLGMLDSIFVRTDLSADRVRAIVRETLDRRLSRLAVSNAVPLEELRWKRLADERLTFRLTVFFGALSLLLVVFALGALSWNVVANQRQEIAIRAALGATPSRTAAWVVGQTSGPVALGVACGLAVTLMGGRVLASALHGVAPTSPLPLLGALLLFSVSALLASLGPALRATRLDVGRLLR